MKLLIATKNPAKFNDLKNSLSDLPFKIISLSDLKVNDDFIETGKTFEENARNKALFYAKLTNLPTISDDGGLEIEVLNNEPGVKTRRWIDNKESSDETLIKYTLLRMKKYKNNKRKAQLRVIICLAFPSGATFDIEGKIEGLLAEKPYFKYNKGFPFDALLYLPDKNKYYYQLKYEEKNAVNHRNLAISKLKPVLKTILHDTII